MKLDFIKTKYFIPSIAVILGLILIILPTNKKSGQKDTDTPDISYYSEELEAKITDLLLDVEGIEKAKVVITLEDTGKRVLAENTSSSSTEYVIINNGDSDEGIKITDIYPEVRGVAVVCTNGNDSAVRKKITSLLSSALGIPTNRITVVG